MTVTKKIEEKKLLADVMDAYFYDDKGNLVFQSENLTSSDITGSADEKEIRNGRGNGLFAKLYSNKKVDISIKTNAFDFSTIAMLAGTTVGTGSGTCYTPSMILTLSSEKKIVLPYEPKYPEKVEFYIDGNLVEVAKRTLAKNEVTFTDADAGKEVKLLPYEFDIKSDDDEYKEIVVRADQFPQAGKLILKGVEKDKSGKNYRDITIIIEKATPSADFSLSTSAEVDATETEIKLSAMVDNGRLMKIIEGKFIDKDNGKFQVITP